jgi:hypothetical protein
MATDVSLLKYTQKGSGVEQSETLRAFSEPEFKKIVAALP